MSKILLILPLIILSEYAFSSDTLKIKFKAHIDYDTFLKVMYSKETFNKGFNKVNTTFVKLVSNVDSVYNVNIEADSVKGLSFVFYNNKNSPTLTIDSISLSLEDRNSIHFGNNQILNEFDQFDLKTINDGVQIKYLLNKTTNGKNFSRISLSGNSLKRFYSIQNRIDYLTDSLSISYRCTEPINFKFYYSTNDKGSYNSISSYLWPNSKIQKITLPILYENAIGDFRLDFRANNQFDLQLKNISLKGISFAAKKLKSNFDYSTFNSAEITNNILILHSKGESSLVFNYKLEEYMYIHILVLSIFVVSVLLFFVNRYIISKIDL